MKKIGLLCVLMISGAGFLAHPRSASSQQPAVVPPTAHPWDLGQAKSACREAAKGTPASEFCNAFVGAAEIPPLLQKSSLGNIASPNGANLANAYSTRLLNGLTSQAENIAFTAPSNVLKRQTTAPATTSGSTSLVAKTAQTQLIAVAAETGALTQSQNGNQITLQANLDHLFHEVFLGSPSLRYIPDGTILLENFTASVVLATTTNSPLSVPITGSATSSSVNTTSVTTNTSATKLSSASVNYEFRNPFSKSNLKKYNGSLVKSDAASRLAQRLAQDKFARDFSDAVLHVQGCGSSDYQVLLLSFIESNHDNKTVESSAFVPFVSKFNDCFQTISQGAETANSKLASDLQAYTTALNADIEDYKQQLRQQLSKWDMSAQYVFTKGVQQPDTHDFRLIGSGDLSKSVGAVWTVNAAASLYGNLPAGAQYGHLKDAQFSAELDRALGSSQSAPSFSIAGYGQYQYKPSVLNITSSSVPSGITLPQNAQVFLSNTQGWLGVVQVKFTLRIGSAQVPIAGKWSNKTDLLDSKNKLGAQFGVSYDFTNLKQLIGLGGS